METEIDVLMADTAHSLSLSLRHCFPARLRPGQDAQNGLPEASIVTHLAIACARRDYAVFPEAANHQPGRGNEAIDLMAFDWKRLRRIDVEAKRLYNHEGAETILGDIQKLIAFQPNPEVNAGYPVLAPTLRYGLVVAITEHTDIADWWANWQEHGHPTNRNNHRLWQALRADQHLQHWRDIIEVKSWASGRPQYLLYAAFPLA